MNRITKVYFDPLATTKGQIRKLLDDLPIGSAHPFSPEHLILCRTATGVDGNLLQYIQVNQQLESGKEFAVFVSGFKCTQLTRFEVSNPVVVIANHAEKALYIVPVPLDAASIGNAKICSPLVFKREEDSLNCSILSTPPTDSDVMCSGKSLRSACFRKAIQRADWNISAPTAQVSRPERIVIEYTGFFDLLIQLKRLYFDGPAPTIEPNLDAPSQIEKASLMSNKETVIFITQMTDLASTIVPETTQIIRYGTGLEFLSKADDISPEKSPSAVVLPCIFGSRLEGPLLLSTGKVPAKVPFNDETSLRACYENLKSVVIYVDERMTDNARNLATPWRINGVFIVQLSPGAQPKDGDVKALLDLVNINAITALAGPQSLVLVQISSKYYFYRGIANRDHLETSKLSFGEDVTRATQTKPLGKLLEPRAKRMVNISETSTVLLPYLGQMVQAQELKDLFKTLSVSQIKGLEDDITAIVPQLHVLFGQKELVDLSRALIAILTERVHSYTAPLRTAYIDFVAKEYNMTDPESVKKKIIVGQIQKEQQIHSDKPGVNHIMSEQHAIFTDNLEANTRSQMLRTANCNPE